MQNLNQIVSKVPQGTAPMTVDSNTVVTNLNADKLDGLDASAFATAAQGTKADNALPASSNAVSATKLATTRALSIGATAKNFDGTAPVSWSLAEIGAAAASHQHTTADVTDINFKSYSTVTQLGLTAGVPTLNEAFAALSSNSRLECPVADFVAGLHTYVGIVEMFRSSVGARSYCYFHGKSQADGEWKMGMLSDGSGFDGTWIRIYDSATVVPVLDGGTGATDAAAARTNLGITPANIGALALGGGTLTAAAYAHVGTDYTTARMRNIALVTSLPTVTTADNGKIFGLYV